MAGGSYNVEKLEGSTRKDTSFRSCVCALLVVLFICIIGLLVTAFIRGSHKEEKNDKDDIFQNENQNQDFGIIFTTKLIPTLNSNVITESFVGITRKPVTGHVTQEDTHTTAEVTDLNKYKTDSKTTVENVATTATSYKSVNASNTKNWKDIILQTISQTLLEATTATPSNISGSEQSAVYENDENTTLVKTNISENYFEVLTERVTEKILTTAQTAFAFAATAKNSQTTIDADTTKGIINNSTSRTFTEAQRISTENFLKSIAFSNKNGVCETASCKSAAVDILMSMNHSVDPCDDFYGFACGRFTKKQSKENEEFLLYVNRIDNNSPGYLKAVKIFFDSCVSHESEFLSKETIQQARKLVDNVGIIQIDPGQDVNIQDFSELLAKLVLRQSVPFFDVDLSVHPSDGNSSYILQLTLPQHSVSEWSSLSENRRRCFRLQSKKTYAENLNLTGVYEAFLECQKNYSVYLDSVENVMRTLGLLDNVKNDSQLLGIVKEIRFTVEDILKILEILPSPYDVTRLLINQDKVAMTLSDLAQNFPQLDWNILTQTLTTKPVSFSATVEVYIFDYFKKAFQEINTLGHKKLYNALLAIYAQDVYANVVFEPVINDRENFCAERTFDSFPDLANYINKINERNLDVERNITTIIFNKLKDQLTLGLSSASNWMESDVIAQFQTKINKMTLRFNEESDFSAADLENRYQNFSMERNAYVDNLERAMVKRRQNLYSLWGESVKNKHIHQFFSNPSSNQPLLFSNDNSLYIPDSILKSIYEDHPFYLSMSSVGWRLAKALMTIFDPINIKSILPKSSTYNSLVESTRDQLKHVNEINFKGRRVIVNWNGSLSVNKRIVDNAAFRLLLDASQPDDSFNELPLPLLSLYYSREKVVFISTIQEFCEETPLLSYMERIYESENLPASLMAENVLINSQNFAATFECKPGSSMNIFDVRYQFPYLEKVEDYNNYEYEISN